MGIQLLPFRDTTGDIVYVNIFLIRSISAGTNNGSVITFDYDHELFLVDPPSAIANEIRKATES